MKIRLAFPLIIAAFSLLSHPVVAKDAPATADGSWMDKASKLVDDLLADSRVKGELRQKAMALKAQALIMAGQPDEGRLVARKLIAMDPNSKTAKQVSSDLEAMIESIRAQKQSDESAGEGKETDSEENNYFGTPQS